MTNNLYQRDLNLPFTYPKPEIFNKKFNKSWIFYIKKDTIDKTFIQWLDMYDLSFSNVIEGFYTKPGGGKIPIHTDTQTKPGVNDVCKINFTWGPSNSVIRFWKVNEEKNLIKVDTSNVNPDLEKQGIVKDIECNYVWTADENNLKLDFEKVISKPSLINVGQLHSTYNPGNEDRYTLCFALMNKNGKQILFNEALEIFKNELSE